MAAGRGPNGTSAGSISAPLRPFGRGNLGSGIARTAGTGNGYCAILHTRLRIVYAVISAHVPPV